MGSLFSSGQSDFRYNTEGLSYGQGAQQAQAQQAQNFAQQQQLAQALQAQMSGAGPSVAQEALRQGTTRGIQQAAGMAASQKGINPALAQRLAAQGAAQMTQEAAGQGALMKAQEQLGARAQLGGLYGQMGQQALSSQGQMLQAQAAQNQINAGIESQNAQNAAAVQGAFLNALGGAASKMAAHGGKIEGKAKVDGDSEINDTVPALLSPGEIVIPRSHADDPEKAKMFIDKLIGSKKEDGEEMSYGKVLEANRKLQERVKALEANMGKKSK